MGAGVDLTPAPIVAVVKQDAAFCPSYLVTTTRRMVLCPFTMSCTI